MTVAISHLGLLAKHWTPGMVKTRLGAEIGMAAASRLHQVFLETLLQRFRHAADRRTLLFTPREKQSEFTELAAGGNWQLEPQVEGDLGARMRHGIESAQASGAKKVVLIGADGPALPPDVLDEAFRRLDDSPVVLGPAEDGGYYLIGVAGQPPDIFNNISWGTASVYEETVERLRQQETPFATLPHSYDVDTREDLLHLRNQLQSATDLSEPLARLQDAITTALAGFDHFK